MRVTEFAVGVKASLSRTALTRLLTRAIPRELWRQFIVEVVDDDDEDGFNWTIQCQAKTPTVTEATAEHLFTLMKATLGGAGFPVDGCPFR